MQELRITFIGNASKKREELHFTAVNTNESLMDFLRSKSFPIASSCYGEGICKKCVINLNGNEEISCQISLKSLTINKTNIIIVDYL